MFSKSVSQPDIIKMLSKVYSTYKFDYFEPYRGIEGNYLASIESHSGIRHILDLFDSCEKDDDYALSSGYTRGPANRLIIKNSETLNIFKSKLKEKYQAVATPEHVRAEEEESMKEHYKELEEQWLKYCEEKGLTGQMQEDFLKQLLEPFKPRAYR